MRHRSKRFLSVLFSLALVLGLMPGVSLTAYADGTSTVTFAGGVDMRLTNVGENFVDVLENTGLDAVFDVQ